MELKKLNCVNTWETSEVANLVFQWISGLNLAKHKFFPVSIVKLSRYTNARFRKIKLLAQEILRFARNERLSPNSAFRLKNKSRQSKSKRSSSWMGSLYSLYFYILVGHAIELLNCMFFSVNISECCSHIESFFHSTFRHLDSSLAWCFHVDLESIGTLSLGFI